MNNIFVYIELENGAVADVSLELLTKGRELADELGVKLEAVVLGHGVAGIDGQHVAVGLAHGVEDCLALQDAAVACLRVRVYRGVGVVGMQECYFIGRGHEGDGHKGENQRFA